MQNLFKLSFLFFSENFFSKQKDEKNAPNNREGHTLKNKVDLFLASELLQRNAYMSLIDSTTGKIVFTTLHAADPCIAPQHPI